MRGYVLDAIPDPHPIFRLIQSCGNVADEEMFRVFNMGIGFCVIVAPEDAAKAQSIAKEHGVESAVIGVAVEDPLKRVKITSHQLIGQDGKFSPAPRQGANRSPI